MKYFIANWKMNMDIKEILQWIEEFSKTGVGAKAKNSQIIVCPSHLHIPLLRECNKEFGFHVGAQDVSYLTKGAHTGDIGAFQLKEFCDFCIVGHSERNEPIETVIDKRDEALSNGITPIVCFTHPKNAKKLALPEIIMAWEDPGNISVNGVYREKDPESISKGIDEIKKQIDQEINVIYGGSVNRENIKSLNGIKGIDGVLVGNASLDPKHFADIINSCI